MRASRTGNRNFSRGLDSFEARPIPGTDGAYAPFFSPDGRSIAFFAANTLQRVSLEGGQPVTLCEARNAHGGAWGPDGTIIFADAEGGKLLCISASGGETRQAVSKDGLAATIWGFSSPEFLPDGDTVLVTLWQSPNPDNYKIAAFSLKSGKLHIVVEGGVNARYLSTGHLVYARSATLIAAPFDMGTATVTGPGVTLVENVRSEEWGSVQYTLALDGTLVYVSGGPAWFSKLVWADRSGGASPIAAPARAYQNFSLSPDGQRLALEISEATSDIYLLFYRNGPKWMAVAVTTNPQFKAGAPRMLFEGPYRNVRGVSYDVAADGRFLLLEENYNQPPTTQLQAIFNWSAEVKRRVAAGSK